MSSETKQNVNIKFPFWLGVVIVLLIYWKFLGRLPFGRSLYLAFGPVGLLIWFAIILIVLLVEGLWRGMDASTTNSNTT